MGYIEPEKKSVEKSMRDSPEKEFGRNLKLLNSMIIIPSYKISWMSLDNFKTKDSSSMCLFYQTKQTVSWGVCYGDPAEIKMS